MRKTVLTSNTSWSIWNFRLGLMRALKNKGYKVIAIAPKDKYSEYISKEFEYVELKNLDRKGKNPYKDVKLTSEYLKLYRQLKPDLVLNYTIKPNIYSSIACGILKIPCISVVTGLGYVYVNEGILKQITNFLYKAAFKFNKKVIFQNQSDKDIFVKYNVVSDDKAVVIYGSGVDTEKFNPNFCRENKKEDSLTFLMIGRLLWDKGVKEYIEAGRKLKEDHPQVKLLLLGAFDEGNPSAVPEDYIKKWCNEGVIEYLGVTDDVRPFICMSDCIVLPSYREGVPRTLLEALSMEKPIITTNAAGCRDVCVDGLNGFLVQPKNVESLYQAMKKMFNLSIEERNRMGKFGRETVLKNFSESVVIEKYLTIIKNII